MASGRVGLCPLKISLGVLQREAAAANCGEFREENSLADPAGSTLAWPRRLRCACRRHGFEQHWRGLQRLCVRCLQRSYGRL